MSISSFWKLKLWINHTKGQGFSESYNLVSTNRTQAKADSAIILSNRALLLPLNTSIVFASVSNNDTPPDSAIPDTYLSDPMELDAETPVEGCNRMKEGIAVNFFTNDGRKQHRLFRALRDSWTLDMDLTVTPSSSTSPGSWVTPAAGFTAADAIGQFLSVCLYKTQHIRKLATDPVTYDNVVFNGYSVEGIGERDVGPGYSFSRGRQRAMV